MTDATRLIRSIREVNALPYVPAVIKMQMVMLHCEWREASDRRDWQRSAECQDRIGELYQEYLPLPSLASNEESALYAAALNAAEK